MYKLIIKSLIVLVIVLAMVRLVVSNVIATSGLALDKIESQTEALKLENDVLNEKLLSVSSLTAIASEAAKIGFTSSSQSYLLVFPNTLAKQ